MIKKKKIRGKITGNYKKILLISFFSFFFFLISTQSVSACIFSKPEIEGNDVVGAIKPQGLLEITVTVYGDGSQGDATVYIYSSTADVSPGNITKYVGKYDLITFTFDVFFNFSSETEYFESLIEFYLYSHQRNQIVDTLEYNAVYNSKDEITINVNNSMVFGFEEATMLKLVAFGIVGSIGAMFIVGFRKARDLIDLEKEVETRKILKKTAKRNLFVGCSMLVTLAVQYWTANVFYPYPEGFNWMWGNELYGVLIAGMVFFTGLMLYRKSYLIGSILSGGILFSFLSLFDTSYLILIWMSVIISILLILILFRTGDWLKDHLKSIIKKEPELRVSDSDVFIKRKIQIKYSED